MYPVELLRGTLVDDEDRLIRDRLDLIGYPTTASLEYLILVYSRVLF
jgi:hypothetical protein